MIRTPTIAVLALVSLAACGDKEEEKDKNAAHTASAHASAQTAPSGSGPMHMSAARPPTSASAATSASSAPANGPAGSLAAAAPAKPVTAKVGERVWALAPGSGEGTALFDAFEVESIQGNTATVLGLALNGGKLGKDAAAKHAGTPGAFIVPAHTIKEEKLKVGAIVIASIPGGHTTVAHVVKFKEDGADVKYEHDDKVKDEFVTYAAPLATGIAPFAYVAAKKGTGMEEILVGAVVDDEVFGVDEAGKFVKVPKADVKPLDVQWKDRKKGEKVTVLADGVATETTIDTVSVEKWVYKVKIKGAEKRVPFYAIVDKI